MISNSCLFFHSTIPFYCEELVHRDWCIIPFFSRKGEKTLLKYFFPLSNLIAFILTLKLCANYFVIDKKCKTNI